VGFLRSESESTSSGDQFPVLLERHLKMLRNANGAFVDVVVEIGYPYWTDLGLEAACPVAIRGAVGRVNDIRSIDPLGAMREAIRFAETYLEHPADDMKFFWPDGEPYDDNDGGAPEAKV
jgi:hypothetical protein